MLLNQGLFDSTASVPKTNGLKSLTIFPDRHLKGVLFSVPPLAEQRWIVAKLDALTARTARARAELDRIPALAARYKKAVLELAFAGLLSKTGHAADPNEILPLVETIDHVRNGPFGSALHKHEYVIGGVPIVNPMHINEGRITPSDGMTVSKEKAAQLKDYRLEEGDLVLARRGVMGRCAVVGADQSGWLIGTGSMAVRSSSKLHPPYLQRFLESSTVVAALEANAVGTTMVNLNQGILLALEIRLPPIAEQIEIVRRIETAFTEVDRLNAEAVAARRLLDRLDQAILAKAFRGELVPQDPADEPASVLLERIKAEGAGAPASKKRGRLAKVAT